MRLVWQLLLCCTLTAGTMSAQRGGGGARGGGFGGGVRGGGFRGGFPGGLGFRGGFGRFGFFNRGFFPYYGFGFGPYFGFGYAGYWPYGYGYDYSPGYHPYDSGYASYQPSPNVTVVYPPPSGAGSSVARLYDQYGQEVRSNASPLYLIAFNDHTIRAALSYRVDGNTLHYVTLEHEDKEAPLNTVDCALSLQLNRERRVPLQLP